MVRRFHLFTLALPALFVVCNGSSQETADEKGREFSVLVYNVENVFDVDGVALFEDYRQYDSPHDFPYDETKLLTKLKSVGQTLKAIDGGKGPDVILFQEFELDRTSGDVFLDYPKILEEFTDEKVSDLLTRDGDLDKRLRKMPAYWWLQKYLVDIGLAPYRVSAAPPPADLTFATSHVNAVFSRFPIVHEQSYVLERARDILEVHIEIDGVPFVLLNNHWKSGASDPQMESVRRGNARVLRHRLDEILRDNPRADVLLAGDFNSHYNHRALFPNLKTGINDVLGSQGDETELVRADGRPLYNLWFELPADERWSEFYRGELGSLMQMLITRGLYDGEGIQYVDNSFAVPRLPGINSHPVTGLPSRWHFFSPEGGGSSDHLPVYARFRKVATDGAPLILENPSSTERGPSRRIRYDFSKIDLEKATPASELAGLRDGELASRMGDIVRLDGPLMWRSPPLVQIGNRLYQLYAYDDRVAGRLGSIRTGDRIEAFGELSEYRGRLQFVIHVNDWLPGR